MTQKTITMTLRELSRYEVIKRLLNKEINGTEAAKQLYLSVRQIKNLKAAIKERGVQGIIHGNRGRSSNRKLTDEKIKQIERIVKEKYYNFGPTFTAEKLDENHQIIISNEKLRRLMTEWRLWKPRPRKQLKKRYAWRARKDNYEEIQQFDGS